MSSYAERLDSFVASIDIDALEIALDRDLGIAPELAAGMAETYLNEASVGLNIIISYLRPGQRILEIGCGIGVLYFFLRHEGYEVVGIEPGAEGSFSFMTRLHRAVADQLPEVGGQEILGIGAEDLSPEVHGQFDIIFSANVLEHILDLDRAIPAMQSVMAPGGIMRHLCPNYHVPYEPHLGIPLVPFFPRVTTHLARDLIARNQATWDGVNFITASQIARLAHQNSLKIEFDGGVMAAYMRRLIENKTYAARHALIAKMLIQRPALVAGLAKLLDFLPHYMASPMTLTLRHKGVRAIPGQTKKGRRIHI